MIIPKAESFKTINNCFSEIQYRDLRIFKTTGAMKLYELLEKVPFEALDPYIRKSANYRCTYDILRHTKSGINEGNIWVKWLVGPDGERYKDYKGEYCIDVYGCDICWNSDHLEELLSNLLGSDIVIVDDDIRLNDDELLETILHELTFDGFTPKKYRDITNAMAISNRYKKAYMDMIYRKNKRYMDKIDKEIFRESYDIYDWESLYYQKKRKISSSKNRSKRKRDFRQENRLRTLKRMGQVEDIVCMLLADGSSLTREQLDWLFRTESIYQNSYQSYSYNKGNRMLYIYGLLTKYNGRLFDSKYNTLKNNSIGKNRRNICHDWMDKEYSRFVVALNVSPEYPLTDEEKGVFDKILALDPKENIMVGLGYDWKLGPEAEIIAISASDELDTEPYFFNFGSMITPFEQ